jgi:hypothetical protein
MFSLFIMNAKLSAFLLGFLLTILLAACSATSHADRDTKLPEYYAQKEAPLGAPAIKPNQQTPYLNSSEEAITSLIATGFSLAAYPGYYRKSSITGKCVITVEGSSSLQTPCVNTEILLFSQGAKEGAKELTRMTTNASGEFAFLVKRDKSYAITIDSPKYKLPNRRGPVVMGDDVVLKVVRR